MPSCARARGRDASMTTSAAASRARNRSTSRWSPKSRATDSWPACSRSKNGAGPRRAPSGRPVLSTLTVRAPATVKSWAHSGPAHSDDRSTTSAPASDGAAGPVASGRATNAGADASISPSTGARDAELDAGRHDLGRGAPGHAGRQVVGAEPGRQQVDVVGAGERHGDPAVGAAVQLGGPAAAAPSMAGQAGDRRPLTEQRRRIDGHAGVGEHRADGARGTARASAAPAAAGRRRDR